MGMFLGSTINRLMQYCGSASVAECLSGEPTRKQKSLIMIDVSFKDHLYLLMLQPEWNVSDLCYLVVLDSEEAEKTKENERTIACTYC